MARRNRDSTLGLHVPVISFQWHVGIGIQRLDYTCHIGAVQGAVFPAAFSNNLGPLWVQSLQRKHYSLSATKMIPELRDLVMKNAKKNVV